MIKKIVIAVGLLLSVSSMSSAVELAPFSIDWQANPDSAVNMSFLLDAPAGKDGFIRIENGRFVKPNGERLRIWGINFSSNACFPAKEDAPKVAEYIARCGINCIRFHHMDNPSTGFLEGNPENSRTLNPDKLDRLDFLIHELKKRGVYTNLNLNVARRFMEGDGVHDAELLGYAKGITYFNRRIVELQKEFARQLLTHYNPYTQSAYCSEPAVVIVEIVNENSLVESWFAGRLRGKNTQKYPGTWSDIPASYEQELTDLYAKWLPGHVSKEERAAIAKEAGVESDGLIPRLTPDEFGGASKLRFHTEASFYMDIEARFFQDFREFLKKDLKVQAAVVGSSDHNHYKSGYPHLCANNFLDVIDGHVYWQHPNYGEERVNGRQSFTIKNTPMVNDPYFSTVVQLSRTAVSGKPYTVSETNHPYPNEYACEGIPLLAAYAMLQDWDGLFFYTFEHATPDRWENRMRGHFDFRPDPMKMINMAASALMFLRGDVQPAEQIVERSYSREQVMESLRLSYQESPYFTPGFPLSIPLIHRTRVASLDGSPSAFEGRERPSKIVSDTGELCWSIENSGKGYVLLDAPKTQAMIGFIRDNDVRTKNLSADVQNEFCAIQCLSLDGKPLEESRRCLLVTASKAVNSQSVWNDKRTSLVDWGKAPMQIETVEGAIVLRHIQKANHVYITPLNGEGEALTEKQPAKKINDSEWSLPIGEPASLWHRIDIE
ncbi:MAG: hypothetical protein JXR73_11745 [Candidatus Omnitrophica bacterium]|nr:hypothetical protein [Candidatus Omnitrophota bacterium]